MHLSHSTQYINYGAIPKVDIAIVEALAITEDGSLIPTTAIGNSPSFIKQADKVIVELNLTPAHGLRGHATHCLIMENPPNRKPINIVKADDLIGKPYMECGFEKIAAIVITDLQDGVRPLAAIDDNAKKIAQNIIKFFEGEVAAGRLTDTLLPIQSGVGSVANAVALWSA